MLLLSLLFAIPPIDSQYLLKCEDYDWLTQGVLEANTLSSAEKLEFITRFMGGTDPKCFED